MSEETERTGVENPHSIWSSRSHWLLDEPIVDQGKPEVDPLTGETRFLKLRALNLQEEMFVRAYIKCGANAKATAKELDTKPSTVNGFLARRPVQAAIRRKIAQALRAADMDAGWVMANLRDVTERCMGDPGDPLMRFDPSNALRGLELIGKSMALFAEKTINENTTIIRIESNVLLPNAPKAIDAVVTGVEGDVTGVEDADVGV